MKTNQMIRIVMLMMVTVLFAGAGAAMADRQAELRERSARRDPQLQQLKKSGKIGETYQGRVEAVGDVDAAARKLIEEENADRRELYELIAAKQETTPQKVAERAAKLNFEQAAAGEMLKYEDGWRKKT